MPIWLLTFLTGLIEPIIANYIKKFEMESRLKAIEKKQQATIEAFQILNSAETSDDFKKASAAIAASFNN